MKRSEQINEIATALSKAQGEFENVLKNNTAKIRTKSGSEYSYSYADLADLLNVIRPALARNNLSIVQGSNVVDGKIIINSILAHSSGQWFENDLCLPIVDTSNNQIQAIGSSITYGRRYEIGSMLGIASEKDDDANVPVAHKPAPAAQIKPSTNALSQREVVLEMGKKLFATPDDFKLWRVDNNLAEVIKDADNFEIAKILMKLKEKEEAVHVS